MNATNQSVAAIDWPSQTRIDGNSIALVCYRKVVLMVSPLCFASQSSRTLIALLAVVSQLEATKSIVENGTPRPESDQMTAEMRDALVAAEGELISTLHALAGPIWGQLPDEVRAVCQLAGM